MTGIPDCNLNIFVDRVYFDKEQSSFQTPLLIKEGQLKKYKIGGKLNNVQWKKYNFSLFNDSIHYSKKYDSQVLTTRPRLELSQWFSLRS